MFAILTYDINKKRVAKILKICRKYLIHRQKSVFDGMITEAKLQKLKRELKNSINDQEDAICIYKIDSLKFTSKEEIGVTPDAENIL